MKKIKDKKMNVFQVSVQPLASHDTNFKIIQNTKNLNKKVFKNIKTFKSFSK